MDFTFTEEQLALRDVARDLFADRNPPARLRDVWDADGERDDGVWKALAQVGLTGLTVPGDEDGFDGDEIDLVLVLEEAGRSALPEPLIETVAVAAPLLAEAGTDEQRGRWLPAIAAGAATATVQFGGAPYVVDADTADVLLCERDGDLHAVPRERVEARRVRTEDRARRLFIVEAAVDATTRMRDTVGAADRARRRAALGTAAFLNGIAAHLLDTTCEYVGAREQFGVPVGSFQAVQHKLATVAALVELSRAAGWYAAYALARRQQDEAVAVSAAVVSAIDAESRANTEALQCHGGIGFTWEHDLHLWLKRGRALEAAHGGPADHRRVLADRLFED